jgi:hypothetical protein
MFLKGEADDEQTNSLTNVINVLARRWPCGFSSRDVAIYAGRAEEDAIDFKAALEMASGKSLKTISATTVAWRLKALADARNLIGNLETFQDFSGGFVAEPMFAGNPGMVHAPARIAERFPTVSVLLKALTVISMS